MDRLCPKCQNCQFKLKFFTNANSNKQNSMVIFTFFVSDWNSAFWGNLVEKENWKLKLKFGT